MATAGDLARSPCATPAVAVRPSVDNRDPRDRRASSAIALLEQRHHSSVVASYDDADILSDEASDVRDSSRPRFLSSIAKLSLYKPALDDDRRGINDTVNTSENDFSGLMTAGPRSDEPPPPTGASRSATSPTSAGDNEGFVQRFRVLEFVVALAMMGFAGVFAIMPTFLREIPHVDVRISSTQTVYARDPTINNKMMPEQVHMSALLIGATSIPIFINVFINYVLPLFKRVRIIPHDTRDFLLSLALSAGISQLITHFVKNMTGRFRPSFYDMCKWDYTTVWDGVTNLCQDKKKEMEGRRSFPSGHASYAWATLFLLTLYLMGRSRLNCENRNETTLRGARKIFKLFLCFAPTLVASWIAVTRSVDNWHHYADILAGSIIGAFAAGFGYSYNYGSIFNWEAAGVPYQEAHVLRKKRDLELEQASVELLRSRTHRNDGELNRTTASYMTGPVSGKGDVSIIVE